MQKSEKCQNPDVDESGFQTTFGIYKPNANNLDAFLCYRPPV